MNEERLNKLLEDIDNALYDLKTCQCNINVTTKGHKWETHYGLDDDLIKYIRKIESSNKNLQSKIDKVIEFIKESNTYYEITHYIPEDEKQFKINMETLTNHLLDILKEDK